MENTDSSVTMTEREDGTWECSEGCPFVFQRDEFSDDVAHHLNWHAAGVNTTATRARKD